MNITKANARCLALLLACAAVVPRPRSSSRPAPPTSRCAAWLVPTCGLQEQRGQVVLVNFWATWCGPCRQEMPHLNRLYDKYRASGFVLLGVNIDDDPRVAADLAAKLGLRFPVLLDTDKQVSRAYDMSAMPATLLIDRDGRVRHIHRGYRDGVERTYEEQVRSLLKE